MGERNAWQGHAGVALDTMNGFTVIECDACRFRHIVPIPTPAELEHVYRHDYYSVDKPLYIQRHIEDREWLDLVYAERYELFERLRQLSEGRTAVYISHRFSTVRQADRILFLERGRLVEEGTHDELMRLGGRYARLFTMQASAYTGETVEHAEIEAAG